MDGQKTVYGVVAVPVAQTSWVDQINEASAVLKEAREELFMASQRAKEARANLDYAEASAWKERLVEGSNDRERRAWLRDHLSEYYQEVERTEQDMDAARLEYEQASIDWQRLRMLCSLQVHALL